MIKLEGMGELLTIFKKVENINPKVLDSRRGKKYVGFLEQALRENKLNLTPLKPSTIKRRIANLGGPLFDTGETARTARIKEFAEGVDAGFFQGDKMIRGKIDAAHLMTIHAEGRGHNPKRDWHETSAEKFDAEQDDKIIDEYLDEVFSNL